MSAYRTLNQLVLAKVETTPGVDAAPDLTNAILIENPSSAADLQTTDTNEHTGSLDARAPIPAGGSRPFSGRVYFKGSGVAGTAPEADPLLRGATLKPDTLGVAATGTAQAGATGQITLASGASATTDLYKGRPITITTGTGTGQAARICTGYNGTTKVATVSPNFAVTPDATSVYNIPASVRYVAQSAVLPNVTLARYLLRSDGGNSKLEKVVGAAGNMSMTLQPRSGCYFDFNYRGALIAPTDVTPPGTAVYNPGRPVPLLGAQVYLGQTKAQLSNFTLDLGCEVTVEEDPNAAFGYGLAGITRRRMGGTMRLPKELESVRNSFDSWATGAEQKLTCMWGSVAGNKMAVLVDHLVFTNVQDEDVEGFAYDSLPYRLNAADDSLYITYY